MRRVEVKKSGHLYEWTGPDDGSLRVWPKMAALLGMDKSSEGTLSYTPKGEAVEGDAMGALIAYLEEYQHAFPSECRDIWEPLVAAAEAQLAEKRAGERVVEIFRVKFGEPRTLGGDDER
jgi:hypothetical protein